ncbi:hypothetical protein K438DRAFT_1984944 [Mycena galopus ATCC 62051]|nr:hypothetical protein K438DRAFT_1984944 [Mycena galopus ATCC 62051]
MAKTRKIGRSAATASEPPSAPPFRFRDKHLKFLEGYNDAFDAVCEEGRWRSFWREVTQAYWLLFPCRLSMDLDPHCGMDLSEPCGKAQFNEMIAIQIATETRIKRYFFHQRHVRRRHATLLANAIAAGSATIAGPATAAETIAGPATAAETAADPAPAAGPTSADV